MTYPPRSATLDPDYHYFRVEVLRINAGRSVQVRRKGEVAWLPVSAIEDGEEYLQADGSTQSIGVASWLAERIGWV